MDEKKGSDRESKILIKGWQKVFFKKMCEVDKIADVNLVDEVRKFMKCNHCKQEYCYLLGKPECIYLKYSREDTVNIRNFKVTIKTYFYSENNVYNESIYKTVYTIDHPSRYYYKTYYPKGYYFDGKRFCRSKVYPKYLRQNKFVTTYSLGLKVGLDAGLSVAKFHRETVNRYIELEKGNIINGIVNSDHADLFRLVRALIYIHDNNIEVNCYARHLKCYVK
jgi:hypothetical protein